MIESAPSKELRPAKIAHKSAELGNSEETIQSESDLSLNMSSAIAMGDIFVQLVQDIKEMKVQLESIHADVALQSGILQENDMKGSCKVCQRDAENGYHKADANWSDTEPSQDPAGRPFYY